MFKSARWKSEKNKIKGVFKLQFHATQLTQLEGDSLMISVVPTDVGKATSRLEKSKVQDGNCYWEKPLYETVKFSHDQKTGKIHEKIYYFIVAKDSSRFGGVGEVSIDFASYVEATKLFSLSLPLKSANFAAILHVSVQRVQGSFDREIDRSESAKNHDQSLMRHFSNGSFEGNIRSNPTEDQMVSNESDINFSRSSSNSTLNTPQKKEPKKIKQTRESSIKEDKSLQWDWLNGSNPKLSTDDSSTSTLGETSEESSSDVIIQKLKAEVVALTRQNDVSELELQTLRKQIMKEIKKGNELSREVAQLKEERNVYQNRTEEVKVKVKDDPWALLDELQKELNHEKELTSNLQLQLEKKQESSTDMVLPLEKSKSKSKSETDDEDDDEEQRVLEEIVKDHSGIKETYLLEQKIIDLYGEIELYKRDKDELEMQMEQIALDYEILKQENHDISYKLERSQLEEQLKIQYEYTPYSNANELESKIESLENELKSKSKELSNSNLVIKDLETHVKNLEEELVNQEKRFEGNLEEFTRGKIENQKRAIRAEENLRKMRLQNVNLASRLQEELRRLSQKMGSAFEVNEKAAMKAIEEADKLRVEKRALEDMFVKVKIDLWNFCDCFEENVIGFLDYMSLKLKQLEKMKDQIENMNGILRVNGKMQNLEGERLNGNLFLLKKKDLQLEIKEFEKKLDSLVHKTEKSQ
ncbi:uncharacterized protein LOC111901145 [Lactuca sativa]|uniref:C2 NT-type domain-containing protein n=1 Tax=Lactuca sativa TaxID=4236 RepID=A0A9R1V9P8_LACSA|nr:uncharacterized protein LOC111901145 [Lactuca sativa]XP_052620722.1 uncharacterized protein LOC111901145 [Lactuca sativa]KAJ0202250.1 hypothetical protein LSAT_V11C600331520 [Lactuca sativa]